MAEAMKLSEVHPDMERFLEHECYCPNEIYDSSGFFYDLFPPDTECAVVTSTDDMTVVVMCGTNGKGRPQCVTFWHDEGDGRIIDAMRCDATENNVGILRDIANGAAPDGRKIDEYEPGGTARTMKKLLSIADFVCVG